MRPAYIMMTRENTIRQACDSDHAALVAILHRQLGDHSLCPPPAALDATVRMILARPEMARLLVALAGDDAGTIVGVAAMTFLLSLEHGGPSAWLEELYVDPSMRGRGVGTALLRAACALASAHGAGALDLEVEAGHERVNGLYERFGFRRHARQRWFLQLDHHSEEERQ
jgi:GNAT superfamily N-acetyltransferase